ncbi:hypothetical protein NVP1031O_038 [Vibrio phage 1.031.O._10N.261.46.F8]|nr:hypothetical protein NVP1031O_038 [Vibrio phage 1.031.O._10N.261.46.F8]
MTDQTNTPEANDPAAAFAAFDVTALAAIVGNAQKQKTDREAAQKSGGSAGWIPNAYAPAGNHTVRVFADPTGVLYRPFKAFTLSDPFKRIMDPRFFKKADGSYVAPDGTVIEQDIIERVWDMTRDLGWQDNARYGVLVYLQVIETDAPSDKWKKGELYLAVMNGKFEDAWLQQVAKLGANPQVAQNIADGMNPTKEGWGWDMTVVKGSQGSVSLTPTIGVNHPAVEIDAKYKPLEEQYVKSEYRPDDMLRLFEQLSAKRIDAGLDQAENDAPVAPGADGSVTTGDAAGQATADQSATTAGTTTDAAVATGGDATQAAAFFNAGQAATTDQAATTTTTTDASNVEMVDGVAPGTPQAFGLNYQQMVAAKNAGSSFQDFANLIGIAQ